MAIHRIELSLARTERTSSHPAGAGTASRSAPHDQSFVQSLPKTIHLRSGSSRGVSELGCLRTTSAPFNDLASIVCVEPVSEQEKL